MATNTHVAATFTPPAAVAAAAPAPAPLTRMDSKATSALLAKRVGAERAQGWAVPPSEGTHTYSVPSAPLQLNEFALGGRWHIGAQAATPLAGGRIAVRYKAKNVYLVLSPPHGHAGSVSVFLDGKARKTIRVDAQRLYHLVQLEGDQTHDLDLRLADGTSAFAFKFGSVWTQQAVAAGPAFRHCQTSDLRASTDIHWHESLATIPRYFTKFAHQ